MRNYKWPCQQFKNRVNNQNRVNFPLHFPKRMILVGTTSNLSGESCNLTRVTAARLLGVHLAWLCLGQVEQNMRHVTRIFESVTHSLYRQGIWSLDAAQWTGHQAHCPFHAAAATGLKCMFTQIFGESEFGVDDKPGPLRYGRTFRKKY